MYIYDVFAIILIGISHVLLYIELIRYHRLSYFMIIILSVVFTILLGIVVTVTGYPELNIPMLLLFLLSLGLMQGQLTFTKNVYFSLFSMVGITLVKLVFMELGVMIFMWTPLNLYLWTGSIIHLIVAGIILVSVWFLRKPIQRFAQYIENSRLYYIIYVTLIIGMIGEIILSKTQTDEMYYQYAQVSYQFSFIVFFFLLLMVLIGSHLTKARLLDEQQARLDEELIGYVEKLEIMHEELASFRHDYVNLLLTLDEGIRAKDMRQIEQIYHEVIAPTSELINNQELEIVNLSKITIPEVKSVLSVKLIAAQQQGIHVIVDIPQTIREITVSKLKFIRMISILVDNGIEAAAESKEKLVKLAFFEVDNRQYFILKNSTIQDDIDLQQIYTKHYSSKRENRGYGLYSLKRILNQTDQATLETRFETPIFTQMIIMKKQ